jgi:hypothetical protein
VSLAGAREFQVALVRPRPSYPGTNSFSFMGNTTPYTYPRWFTPANRAANQIPILFTPTMDIDINGGATWYGTDVKFRITPGQ